jgi:hypothetical protein
MYLKSIIFTNTLQFIIATCKDSLPYHFYIFISIIEYLFRNIVLSLYIPMHSYLIESIFSPTLWLLTLFNFRYNPLDEAFYQLFNTYPIVIVFIYWMSYFLIKSLLQQTIQHNPQFINFKDEDIESSDIDNDNVESSDIETEIDEDTGDNTSAEESTKTNDEDNQQVNNEDILIDDITKENGLINLCNQVD